MDYLDSSPSGRRAADLKPSPRRRATSPTRRLHRDARAVHRAHSSTTRCDLPYQDVPFAATDYYNIYFNVEGMISAEMGIRGGASWSRTRCSTGCWTIW